MNGYELAEIRGEAISEQRRWVPNAKMQYLINVNKKDSLRKLIQLPIQSHKLDRLVEIQQTYVTTPSKYVSAARVARFQ